MPLLSVLTTFTLPCNCHTKQCTNIVFNYTTLQSKQNALNITFLRATLRSCLFTFARHISLTAATLGILPISQSVKRLATSCNGWNLIPRKGTNSPQCSETLQGRPRQPPPNRYRDQFPKVKRLSVRLIAQCQPDEVESYKHKWSLA
jgi:hypothetical protein